MDYPDWWAGFERYWVLDALHEAGHAIAATLMGAANVRLYLDPENWEDRGSVDFDLDPALEEPDGGWEVDLGGAGADAFVPLSPECDVPTRSWVVTRAGGVGGLVGCRSLGLAVEVDGVMESCEHDDRALDRLLRSAPATAAAQRWVDLRYRETWALLLRHEDAVVAVAGMLSNVTGGAWKSRWVGLRTTRLRCRCSRGTISRERPTWRLAWVSVRGRIGASSNNDVSRRSRNSSRDLPLVPVQGRRERGEVVPGPGSEKVGCSCRWQVSSLSL